jgi:hypothetical protein
MVTHLLRDGKEREYVKWIRRDAIRESIDIYFHIDPNDVRRSYLAHIPQLGSALAGGCNDIFRTPSFSCLEKFYVIFALND